MMIWWCVPRRRLFPQTCVQFQTAVVLNQNLKPIFFISLHHSVIFYHFFRFHVMCTTYCVSLVVVRFYPIVMHLCSYLLSNRRIILMMMMMMIMITIVFFVNILYYQSCTVDSTGHFLLFLGFFFVQVAILVRELLLLFYHILYCF